MPRINNKVEVLRSLERTKEQFEVQYRENCDGTESGAFPEFSDADLEFMESFKKIYELGISQLQDFVNQLDEKSNEIDEYSILYYITQLNNGPYSNYFKQFTANRGPRSIYAPSNDQLGAVTHSLKSNSTVPVFNSNSVNAGLSIFNKSTGFIQRTLGEANRQTSKVFDYNFQSSIFDDNTLPYIDKSPRARANAEANLSFGAASLGIGEMSELGPRFISAATSAAEDLISQAIGQIAIAGNNQIIAAVSNIANLNPTAATQGIVQSITNSVVQNANNGSVGIIQQAAGQVQIAGNGLVDSTIGSLNSIVAAPLSIPGNIFGSGVETAANNIMAGGTGFGTTIVGGIAQNAVGAIGNIGQGLLPGLFNTSQGIVQNAGNQLLNSGTGILQNAAGLLQGNLQNSLQGAVSLFSNQGISLNSISFDNIVQGAVGNLQGIGQGILTNAASNFGAQIGQKLGGKGSLLGSFAISVVGGLFSGKSPTKPSQSPVNALGGGGGSWSPGTANGNYMIRDIKMHNIISESTEDIMSSLEASLGSAFRLLMFKKTLNYFNAEENESVSTGDPISRLLTFMKKARDSSGNEQFKQECVEIETSLLGTGVINNRTNDLKAYYNTGTVDLYTNTGRLGNRPIKPGDADEDIKRGDRTKDDIFTTVIAATGRSIEIGCVGYHQHNEDGTTYYMPCSSMEEYCGLTGNCPEPEDPDHPLIGDVDCDVPAPMATTPNPYDRPSPFVDVISALSQEEVPSDQQDLPEY